jgi:hypothetical protein
VYPASWASELESPTKEKRMSNVPEIKKLVPFPQLIVDTMNLSVPMIKHYAETI